ncbi:MAG: hypothetical protein R2838_09575 [Caldilineaceae bacterium]
MTKIAFIGAGSTVFAKNLLGDILSYPELQDATISLHDIDPERLRTSQIVANKVAAALGAKPTIEASLDRRQALADSDYAITMIQVGGYKPSTVIDFEIPKKYGLRQTIADTLGIGGIAARTACHPVLLDIIATWKSCADATLLQYVNFAAANCWAINRATSGIRTVGLCHSVQGTTRSWLPTSACPEQDQLHLCAGINHMAFYLKFERDGRSLPRDPACRRKAGCLTGTGCHEMFPPWATSSPSPASTSASTCLVHQAGPARSIEEFNIPRTSTSPAANFNCPPRRPWRPLRSRGSRIRVASNDTGKTSRIEDGSSELDALSIECSPSAQPGIRLPDYLHSMETGQSQVIYGNVLNDGLIDNLPQDCCVEVPQHVDSNGVQPVHISTLPVHLTALMQTNINVQRLTVEAALTGKARAHLPRSHARSPGRVESGSDLESGGRSARGARRLAAGLRLTWPGAAQVHCWAGHHQAYVLGAVQGRFKTQQTVRRAATRQALAGIAECPLHAGRRRSVPRTVSSAKWRSAAMRPRGWTISPR